MGRGRIALVVLALAAAPVAAQDAGDGPLATVEHLFEAMRARDTAGMRVLMHPHIQLVSAGTRGGEPTLRFVTLDEWLDAVGAATVELDERIWDPEVEIDHELAAVWVKYEFAAGGRFSHCGVDAFQLFRSPVGWRIFHVADTQRRENCWHKPT